MRRKAEEHGTTGTKPNTFEAVAWEACLSRTEMLDLALLLEPVESTEPLARRWRHQMRQGSYHPGTCVSTVVRRKQVYSKHQPKKREVPPPKPFEPEEHFLDFVQLLDPLAPVLPEEVLK